MGRPFIVLGDGTDHGGTVVEASMLSDTHGKGIARVGDKVTCPRPGHGTTVIVTGDPTMIIDGQPAARHGDKCACGATLISSQAVSTVGGGGGVGATPPAGQAPAAAVQSATDHSPPISESTETSTQSFDHRFELTCSLTNMPLAFQPYRLSVDGKVLEGVTDERGCTQTIATGNSSAEVTCEILGDARHGQ